MINNNLIFENFRKQFEFENENIIYYTIHNVDENITKNKTFLNYFNKYERFLITATKLKTKKKIQI